jgi:hypothetical protein
MAAFLQIMVMIVSPLIFVIGLVKPKWILFWMKEPDRLWATSLALLVFMASVTAWSEMRLQHKSPQQQEREMEHQRELSENKKQDGLRKKEEERRQRESDQQNDLQLDRI